MRYESASSSTEGNIPSAIPYSVTKPPPWRTLIIIDLYCAELAAGLFISAALGDLIAADVYGTVARIGYLAAFPISLIDLLCLVFDLGDPARFHHMLRVFKARSPMSTGTWAISAFSLLAFVCFILAVINLPGLQEARAIIGGVGLPIALYVGGYKGVMLSCTAQPIWKSARWLGAELVTSAAQMGVAGLLLAAVLLPASLALPGLRLADLILLCINVVFTLLFGVEGCGLLFAENRLADTLLLSGLILFGWIAPFVLLLLGKVPELIVSSWLILAAGLVYRHELVMYPNRSMPSTIDQVPSRESQDHSAAVLR